jgi:MATE family multidrug resistance protein
MLILGIVFLALGPEIADLFSDDGELVLIAGGLIAFCAWILIADGGQVVLAHALRGRGDAWVPTASHVLSYWGIMVPGGYLFAVAWDGGVLGLFWSILVASIVSVGLLAVRFYYLSWMDRRYTPETGD